MSKPFAQWSARIEEAVDDQARRALLGEIGVWRAGRLMDIPAQRSAAWALSKLYHQLGEKAPAANEAQQLLALCRTAPNATGEELRFAENHARQVDPAHKPARAARNSGREERPARGERGGRERSSGPDVAALAEAGEWTKVTEALRGRRGARAGLFRVWAELELALALEGEAQASALKAMSEGMRERLLRNERGGDTGSALAGLLGGSVPRNRDGLVSALESALEADPSKLDELAASALRHHVGQAGTKSPAPWLVGLTARSLAHGEAKATRQAIRDLSSQQAYAVTAYGETPFRVLVDLWREASGRGATFVALRRGVMSKRRLGNRRPWTLRFNLEGHERLVVVAPDNKQAYDDQLSVQLARRISDLGSLVAVGAPGLSNGGFRAACVALGVSAIDGYEPKALLEAVLSATPTKRDTSRKADKVPTERAPRPLDEIEALFRGETPAEESAYAPHLAKLRRTFKAFAAVRNAVGEFIAADADERLGTFLRAVHTAAPEGVRLSEGASIAIRMAAAVPDGQVARLVLGDDESIASRFGGPGIRTLIGVVGSLPEGWTVHRILRGLTRRERADNPALDALADATGGLWRLVVRDATHEGEIWFPAEDSPELEAVVPLLPTRDRPRLVVVEDPALAERLSGFDPMVWSDETAAAVPGALAAWPERAAPAAKAGPAVEQAPMVEASPEEASAEEASAAPAEAAPADDAGDAPAEQA